MNDMTNDTNFLMLEDIFRSVFRDSNLSLSVDTTASDIPGWDSFNHISLISRIEKKWKIRFSLEELQSLQRVGDIVSLLKQKCPEKCQG